MALVYLHDFLELNDEFAEEFKDTLRKISSVDRSHQRHLETGKKAAEKFFRDARATAQTEETNKIRECLKHFEKAKTSCKQKKGIAQHAMGRMDKLLAHLDKKLGEFERELEASSSGCTAKLKEQSLLLDTEESPYLVAKGRGYLSRGRTSSTPRRQRPRAAEVAAAQQAEEEDNQLYCICRQVSHGDMIGCENDDCPIGWFHLPCVGLKEAPEGAWYCHMCRDLGYPKEPEPKRKKKA